MLEEHLNLYKSLNKNRVKYLVIGGIACGIYGSPRATKDIDILIEPSISNVRKLYKALEEVNFVTVHLTTPEKIIANEITIFNDYIRLDVLTKAKGIEFETAWKRRTVKYINKVPIKCISLDDLIHSKIVSNREIDRIDLEILKKIKSLE
jgi:predicted nucleotidyltransferase